MHIHWRSVDHREWRVPRWVSGCQGSMVNGRCMQPNIFFLYFFCATTSVHFSKQVVSNFCVILWNSTLRSSCHNNNCTSQLEIISAVIFILQYSAWIWRLPLLADSPFLFFPFHFQDDPRKRWLDLLARSLARSFYALPFNLSHHLEMRKERKNIVGGGGTRN